jgi:translation initiation factor 1A
LSFRRPEGSSRELRNPVEGEIVGVVVQLLGYNRVKVRCVDGKIRVARIPGRMIKKVWLRENDIVLVAPWDFQSDEKADVVWRYDRGEVKTLKAKGLLGPLA